jgi:hypothetical protein
MPFQMKCPHCQKVLNVTEKALGKVGSCPACKKPIQIPQPAEGHGAVEQPFAFEPPPRQQNDDVVVADLVEGESALRQKSIRAKANQKSVRVAIGAIAVIGLLAAFAAGSYVLFVLLGSRSIGGIPIRSGGEITSLDHEAAEKAIDLWKPVRIGNSYYLCELVTLTPLSRMAGGSEPNVQEKHITEFLEPWVKVSGRKLEQADRLNGVEWSGSIQLCASSARKHPDLKGVFITRTPKDPRYAHWSEWENQKGNPLVQPDIVSLSLMKKNGKWQVCENMFERQPTSFCKITASEIPK